MKQIITGIFICLCTLIQQNCKSQNNIKYVKNLTQDSLIKKLKVHTIHVVDDDYVVAPLRTFMTFIYNGEGQLIEREKTNPKQQATNRTMYTYNDKNLLILDSTIENSIHFNGTLFTYKYIYDSMNRLAKKRIISYDPYSEEEEYYKYNNLNLLDTLIKSNAKIIYMYNSNGLCIKTIIKPVGEAAFEKKYVYNSNGWEIEEINSGSNYKTEYNNKGQKTKMYRYIGKYIFLYKYEYNSNGLLKESSYNRKENNEWKLNNITKYSYTFY